MTPRSYSKSKRELIAKLSAGAAVLISVTVLIGWLLDIALLKSIVPNFPEMKPNTAVAFLIAGIGLYFAASEENSGSKYYISASCGVAVYLIGSVTLGQYIFGFDARIDGLLLPSANTDASAAFVGRMSPHSAFNFTALGLSLVLLGGRRRLRKSSEILALLPLVTTFAALLGYLYGAERLYGVTRYNSMALPTAGLFVILAAALLAINYNSRVVKLLLSRSLGGIAARRLLPAVILIPTFIGWLRILGEGRGLFDTGFGAALSVFSSVVLMFAIIFYYSQTVHRVDMRRSRAEQNLADNESRYRDLFDHSQGLICIHNLKGILSTVNPAALTLLGYNAAEMVGRNLRDFVPDEYWPRFDAQLRVIEHEGIAAGLLSLIAKNGKKIVLRYHNVLVSEPDKEPYVLAHAQDVTELLKAQHALQNLSLTDELTGLYNRRGFLTLAEQQIKLERHEGTARGLVLMFADMDGLKQINDRWGHGAGSDAIVNFSKLLKSVLRSADLVARWGGDEFVILTIGSSDEGPDLMIDRIQNTLRRYNEESMLPYDLACSIGVAPVRVDDDMTFEQIIAEADAAMYEEKRRRKERTGVTVR